MRKISDDYSKYNIKIVLGVTNTERLTIKSQALKMKGMVSKNGF